MGSIRFALGALALVASLSAPPALATSYSADQSDLWYIAAESGWGMQLVQRGSIIFATLFVYGPGGAPTWYVATINSTDGLTWTGDLYATTGPWFGTVPFNPANVIDTKVGTMTWTVGQTVDTGSVSYTVNGTVVSKNVIRQTLVLDDFSGSYGGVFHQVFYGCSETSLNGAFDSGADLTVTQNGQTLSLTYFVVPPYATTGPTCTANATLSQNGQMGSAQGTFSCNDSNQSMGTLSWSEMQVNRSGFTTRFEFDYTSPPGCHNVGWFGGGRYLN